MSKELIESLLFQERKDWATALSLFKNRHYSYSLFFGQLVLEKILKALIVKKTNEVYPPIHSLTKLAQRANLSLTEKQQNDLEEISSYNISARYDDIKLSFYKKATRVYSTKWLNIIKELKKWIENQF